MGILDSVIPKTLRVHVLVGQVFVGGLFQKGSPVVAENDYGTTYQVDVPEVKVCLVCSYTNLMLQGSHIYELVIMFEGMLSK